jgi:hypothetical protein
MFHLLGDSGGDDGGDGGDVDQTCKLFHITNIKFICY